MTKFVGVLGEGTRVLNGSNYGGPISLGNCSRFLEMQTYLWCFDIAQLSMVAFDVLSAKKVL